MRPIMVEFTGTPEAGKTTVIKRLQKQLEEQGFKVTVIQESAELVPPELPKGSWDANVWMRYNTCSKLLHAIYMPVHIILVDRGSIDHQFFGLRFFKRGMCSLDDYISYMGVFTPNLNPDFLITLVTEPEVSLERRGGPGRLVNLDFLKEYNNLLYDFYETITVPKTLIETSNLSIDDVTSQVYEIIYSIIKAR